MGATAPVHDLRDPSHLCHLCAPGATLHGTASLKPTLFEEWTCTMTEPLQFCIHLGQLLDCLRTFSGETCTLTVLPRHAPSLYSHGMCPHSTPTACARAGPPLHPRYTPAPSPLHPPTVQARLRPISRTRSISTSAPNPTSAAGVDSFVEWQLDALDDLLDDELDGQAKMRSGTPAPPPQSKTTPAVHLQGARSRATRPDTPTAAAAWSTVTNPESDGDGPSTDRVRRRLEEAWC